MVFSSGCSGIKLRRIVSDVYNFIHRSVQNKNFGWKRVPLWSREFWMRSQSSLITSQGIPKLDLTRRSHLAAPLLVWIIEAAIVSIFSIEIVMFCLSILCTFCSILCVDWLLSFWTQNRCHQCKVLLKGKKRTLLGFGSFIFQTCVSLKSSGVPHWSCQGIIFF